MPQIQRPPAVASSAQSSNPMTWDWAGMEQKADKFKKLAKTVQEFQATMAGQDPDQEKRISQVGQPQQAQPPQPIGFGNPQVREYNNMQLPNGQTVTMPVPGPVSPPQAATGGTITQSTGYLTPEEEQAYQIRQMQGVSGGY